MACDPNQLMADAKCLECALQGMEGPVMISLLCTIRDNGGGGGGGTPALPTNQIFVGNAANVATAVAMSGDATIVASGAVTLANSATTRTHLGLGTTDAPQFARLGLGVAADATIPLTVLVAGVGTTPANGIFVENTTAAGAGAQQYSPAIQLRGAGWKTNAVAGSQTVDFQMYVLPVQGTANPTGLLTIQSSVNGAAFANPMYLDTANRLALGTVPVSSQLTVLFNQNTDATNTGGANSHILMSNNAGGAQIVVSAVVSGTTRGKWRTDGSGNLNWIANGGNHFFFVGGDFGVGTIIMTLNAGSNLVDASNGFSVGGAAGVNGTFDTGFPNTQITFVGGLATAFA